MTHCWEFANKKVVSSMIWWCVFFNIRKFYKLKKFKVINHYKKINKLHTDCVARICNCGSVDSNSFWTIFKKLSTNKFSCWAWHANSNWSIASIAMITNLKYTMLLKDVCKNHILTHIFSGICLSLLFDKDIHQCGQAFLENLVNRRLASPSLL